MDAEFENHLKVAEEFSIGVLGPYGARPPSEDIWRYFVAKGAHSRWNYARGLSRVLRSLTAGIREHRHQPTGTL
ncbi:hypothetical protein [Streptomyces sp. NPDC048340]|uniref:hypothetical protein n=1 Tax=Streptomyces sp. NPDC048340 TaxID=3365537 RepID=UPI0037150530